MTVFLILGCNPEKKSPPNITSISPSSGSIAGGTLVTISGNHFISGAIATIGGSECAVSSVSDTQITCTTSAHAEGVYTVMVTNPNRQNSVLTSGFTYQGAPSISSISPTTGFASGGTPVTITGSGFNSGAAVSLGGSSCTGVSVVNSSTITCTTSAHAAGVVSLVVTNSDAQSATKTTAFTFVSAPSITSVSPGAGALAGGTGITITGTNFSSGATVDLDGSACTGVTIVSSTSITCTTAVHVAGAATLTVTNSDTQSDSMASAFTYQAAPTVTSVSPNEGALGGSTSVTINGTGFIAGATATFGGTACTSLLVTSSTTITCDTPLQLITGAVNVVVTNSDAQSGTLTNGYTYNLAPTVTSVSANAGPLAGLTNVTITGTGFNTGATVDFGGAACTSVTVVSATSITCTTPAHAAGAVTVTVTNTDTQSGSLAAAFSYQVAPTVTSVSANAGAVGGLTNVTITGTGFLSGATVDFGGSACTSVTVVSSTSITCTTPAHAAGAVAVTVTNTDTQSGTAAGAYTYQVAPTVTSVAPTSGFGMGGTAVTITGTDFLAGATVDFGGAACTAVTVVNSTTITCTTPAHAGGAVTVTVTNADTQSGNAAAAYTFTAAPTITTISPSAGALAGSTAITITGTDFDPAATVDIGGVACANIIVVSSTSITCDTPANVAGAYNVVVTNPDTQTDTVTGGFTYQPAPTVTSVSANAGALAGNTAVTITGTGFVTGATVDFDASACTSVSVVNSTTITCTTPAHAAGAVAVTVTNADTQTGSAAAAYTYQAAPTVTGVAPATGFAVGGTAVTITGTDFVAGATVDFGGSACTGIVVVNATTITCNTPAHAAGAVTVTVTNADTQSGNLATAYTFEAAPTVASVSPSAGALGGTTAITITGTNFVAGATVDIGGNACAGVTVVSATSITCTTPAHVAGAVAITVTNPDTQSGNLAAAYTYQAAPAVTSVSPATGFATSGTAVTITGTDFLAGATVDFDGSACTSVTVVNSTTITCTTPTHAAGAVAVTVTNTDSQTGNLGAAFTYQAAPTVTGVAPATGFAAGNDAITITGTEFAAGATVDIGGAACTGVTVVNATTITCTTPAHAAGAVAVTVTNTDTQSGNMASAFTYVAAPAVTSVSPSAGALAGGTAVTITGTDFVNGATVDFGGSACTSVTVVSSTSITCTTAVHVAGAVAVTVTNPDTQTGNLAAAYTYQAAPTVASVSPSEGALGGGTAVTITGTDFVAGATATFGGNACTGLLVVNATTITCTTPLQLTTGAVNIVVTNADTQSGTLNSGYTYNLAPTVSSISPSYGPLAGGTAVTITGTGFNAGATVDIGGAACGALTVVNSTTITCTTALNVAGAANVSVTNTDTQFASLASGFTYQGPPTVTAVSPNVGPLAGGATVTITGTNFVTGASVSFGGTACPSVNVVSSTSITCTIPAHIAGAVTVAVTNTDLQAGSMAAAYTYQAAPTVSSVSPSAGPLSGLASVTITGTGFVTGATVTFDGSACTAPIVVNSTTITCSTPAHAAGFVPVAVTNSDGQSGSKSNAYIYIPSPTVTSVSPLTGALGGGTSVTITGTDFIAGATVEFDGSLCTSVNVVSSTSITCSTPLHAAGAVTVKVTNPDSQFGSAANAFTYQAAPTVTTVTPNAGPLAGSTGITISGTGFLTGATVDVGGSPCTSVTVVNSTTITCTTPANGAGAVAVAVTNNDTQTGSAAAAFTYQVAPTVSSVSPSAGSTLGGTALTITGTGFVSGATVDLGGAACASVTVVNATTITCTTPVHSAGAITVTVSNSDYQSGSLATGYTFQAAPTVTSVSANAGALGGNTAVTITGTGFLAGATVDFGGAACASVTIVSSTSITCTTPAHAAGAVIVSVTNTDSQSGSLAAGYTYQAAPTVTGVSANAGALAGGTAVTITGTGFVTGATVDFSGSACNSVSVVNATTITCTTSTHAAGVVNVTVTNADTQSGSAVGAYTYQAAPTVTSVAPNEGVVGGGTAITITGTDFLAGATVDIGGSACTAITVVNSTSITCTTPAHAAGAVNVVITNTDTQTGTGTNAFTYRAAPTVTAVSPATGSINGGTPVTITGTGFYTGATVDFGGSACASVTVVSSTSITCTTAAHVAATVNITVTNADTQNGSLAASYTYASMATLAWQTGGASPNPPNPDSYGTTSTNVTHTYTLTNTGDLTTTAITTSITGADSAGWIFGTNNCSGATLASGASCTVQVTFLGQYLPAATAYSATLEATAAAGGTTTNNMTGVTP